MSEITLMTRDNYVWVDAQTDAGQLAHTVTTHIKFFIRMINTKDAKLPNLPLNSNRITSAEVNCHSKVKLNVAPIHIITKDRLTIYAMSTWTYSSNIPQPLTEKPVQMMLILKDIIKPLDEKTLHITT